MPISEVFQKMFSQPKGNSSFIKGWKYVYEYVRVHVYVYEGCLEVSSHATWKMEALMARYLPMALVRIHCVFQMILNVALLCRGLEPHQFPFRSLLWILDVCRKGQRGVRPGEWTKDPGRWTHYSWYPMWPVCSWAITTTGSRRQGSSATTRNKLEGNACGDDIKNRPNGLLVLGWCQNIQCFNVVITRCSSPSMTRWELRGQSVTTGEKSSNSWDGK